MTPTRRQYLYILTGLCFLTTLPFLFSSAERWDLVAHIQEAELQLEMFPYLSYWNGYHSLGYEPYVSYSLLPRVVTALLGGVVGVPVAAKILLTLAWCSYPICLLKFFESVTTHSKAILGTSFSIALLYLSQWELGFDYISAFHISNYAAVLSFPVFLLSVEALLRRDYDRALLYIPVALLTHLISFGLLVGVMLIVFFEDIRSWKIFFALGFVAFWLVPFLFSGYQDVSTYGRYMTPVVLSFAVFVLGHLWWSWTNPSTFQESVLLSASTGLVALFAYRFWHPTVWAAVPVYYHRLFIPVALFLIALTVERMPYDLNLKQSVIGSALLLVVGFGLASPTIMEAYHFSGVKSVPKISSRGVFILNSPKNMKDLHSVVYRYIRKHDKRAMPALFVESVPASKFIFAVQKALSEGNVFQWGGKAASLSKETWKAIRDNYDSLPVRMGAGAGVSLKKCEDQYTKDCINAGKNPVNFVDVLPNVGRWSDRPKSRVGWLKEPTQPFYAKGDFNSVEEAGAKVTETANHLNRFDVAVRTEKPVPVHIKVSHSDAWKAVDASGEQLEIKGAFPLGMIVETDENFSLIFQGYRGVHRVGIFLTLLSFGIFGVSRVL